MTRMTMIIAALVLTAAPAFAQVSAGLNEAGTRGAIESGKYSNEDTNLTSFDLDLYYGRFITDRWEVGPSFNVFKLEGQDASGGVGAFVDYHFGDTGSQTIPYVEGGVGRLFGAGDFDSTYFAVGPGVKWFFGSGGGALSATALYRRQMFETGGANDFIVNVGVAIYFGR